MQGARAGRGGAGRGETAELGTREPGRQLRNQEELVQRQAGWGRGSSCEMEGEDGQTTEDRPAQRRNLPSEVVVLIGVLCNSLWDKFKLIMCCRSWKLAMQDGLVWETCWIDWADDQAPRGSAHRYVPRMISLVGQMGPMFRDFRVYDRVRMARQSFDVKWGNAFVTRDLMTKIRDVCSNIETIEIGADTPNWSPSQTGFHWPDGGDQHDPALIAEGALEIVARAGKLTKFGCNLVRGTKLLDERLNGLELTSVQCEVCLDDYRHRAQQDPGGDGIEENVHSDLPLHPMCPITKDDLDRNKLVQCEVCTGWTCMPCAGAQKHWGSWFRHCRSCRRTICLKCDPPMENQDPDERLIEGVIYPDGWAGQMGSAFACGYDLCETKKRYSHMVCNECKPPQAFFCKLHTNMRCNAQLVCVGACEEEVRKIEASRNCVLKCEICKNEGCHSCMINTSCSLCGKKGCSQCKGDGKLTELYTKDLFCAEHAQDTNWGCFKEGMDVGDFVGVCGRVGCLPGSVCIIKGCTVPSTRFT